MSRSLKLDAHHAATVAELRGTVADQKMCEVRRRHPALERHAAPTGRVRVRAAVRIHRTSATIDTSWSVPPH